MDGQLSERQRHEIAGRARTLHERLEGPPNVKGSDPPIEPDRIVAAWKATFPGGGVFAERLEAEGLTEAAVREQVTKTRWPPDEPLPDWIAALESLIRSIESSDPPDQDALTVDEDRPFAELLQAIVDHARDQLPQETVQVDDASPMEDWLADRLVTVAIRPLYVEFKSYVEHFDPELAATEPDEIENPPSEHYEGFVEAVFDGGFSNVCVEYPVLARHLVRVVDFWVDAVTEVCRRVHSDAGALRDRFDVDGEVIELEPLAEDTHARGRVPVRVSFETGSVIYKPRPVGGEKAFYAALSRLDDRLSVPSFRSPDCLRRDTYGWMEVVEHRDAEDTAAVDRYYERAGAVLCLAYLLNLTDVQLENVIASGEHPTVVDGETLFHPHADPEALPYNAQVASVKIHSVMVTSLLPFSVNHPEERDVGHVGTMVAGFGDGEVRTASGLTLPEMEAINTDVMSVGEQEMEFDSTTNAPAVDGRAQPPGEHVDAVCRGFERTYAAVSELRDEGRFFGEVLNPELLDGLENRFLFRPTIRYVSVLLSATGRDVLRDGIRFTVEMERLATPFFTDTVQDDRLWSIYEAERRALRRLDVPRFGSRVDGMAVTHDGDDLDVETGESGYERSKRRVEGMNEADRRRQAWFIRQSLGVDLPTDPPPQSPAPTDDDRLRREAIDLFDGVVDARVETPDRREWVSMFRLKNGFSLCPADDSLYSGRCGIALTAAALAALTGRDEYGAVAAEAVQPIVEDVRTGRRDAGTGSPDGGSRDGDLGGYRGTGATVYTLSVLADLLDEDEYRKHALEATRTITDERLASDDELDVMSGTAGALLALLAHHERFGGDTVLDRAVACGDRLLDARVDVEGYRVWNDFVGFAHGAAGIAYALARLGAATGNDRYFEAVEEALAFQSEMYSPDRRNWAKHRVVDDYTDRWCHGRSGVVLSRLGMDALLDGVEGDASVDDSIRVDGDDDSIRAADDAIQSDVEQALPAIVAEEPSAIDHVCCGNLGRVETLLVRARRTDGDPADARELLGRCLARREREGALTLDTHVPEFVNPGFFKGASGAAYTMLRVSNPDELPCLLLLE